MSSLDVKKIRALTGKTQSEFAKLFGVSRGAVVLWESNDPDRRTRPKLTFALQMKKIESKYEENEDKMIHAKEDKEFSDLKIDDKLNLMNDKLNILNELLNK